MVLSGCRIRSNLTNEDVHHEGGTRRRRNRTKNEKSAKAKRILVGADVHLRCYQAARKVDNGVIGVVENFRSVEALLLHVEKQCERAEQVAVVYEAGPLGFTLYRMLKARGVLSYVCAPDSIEQQRKRRKNNKIDARNLTSKLFNYLNGDREALQLARVPSEWNTGDKERRGSITKVGVPAIRRIIIEMVWRMILFQPQYKPVQKWQEVLRGTNPAVKKKGSCAVSVGN
jgi:transposase